MEYAFCEHVGASAHSRSHTAAINAPNSIAPRSEEMKPKRKYDPLESERIARITCDLQSFGYTTLTQDEVRDAVKRVFIDHDEPKTALEMMLSRIVERECRNA